MDARTFDSLPSRLQDKIRDTAFRKAEALGLDVTQVSMVERTLSLYHAASDDIKQLTIDGGWYEAAHELVTAWAGAFNLPEQTVAGVLAICSPQTSWTRNREDAHVLLTAATEYPDASIPVLAERILDARRANGGSLTTQPRLFIERALRMIRGEPVAPLLGNGPKVRNFYLNILYPHETHGVTVDTHMIRALLDLPDMASSGPEYRATLGSKAPQSKADGYTDGLYPWFALVIKIAADMYELLPHQMQAIVWCQWRRAQGSWGGTQDRDPTYLRRITIRAILDGPID